MLRTLCGKRRRACSPLRGSARRDPQPLACARGRVQHREPPSRTPSEVVRRDPQPQVRAAQHASRPSARHTPHPTPRAESYDAAHKLRCTRSAARLAPQRAPYTTASSPSGVLRRCQQTQVRAQRCTPRAPARATHRSRLPEPSPTTLPTNPGARAALHASRPSARHTPQPTPRAESYDAAHKLRCARSAARFAPQRAPYTTAACPEPK
jgi:hypothetical protein